MLKPRYNTIGESVSDFNDLLEDMNKTQPIEHHRADAEVRARQDEERLRRELQHIENVISGSGHFFTEREKNEWYAKRDTIAEMLGLETSPIEESRNAVNADPAINSRYQNGESALERFRVLSGIQEQTSMPRDAGIFGSTRHNANYDEIADQTLAESVSEDSSDKWRGSMSRLKGKELSEAAMEPPTTKFMGKGESDRRRRERADDLASHRASVAGHKPGDSKADLKFHKKQLRKIRRATKRSGVAEDAEYQEGGGSRRTKEYRQDMHVAKERGLRVSPADHGKVSRAFDRPSPKKMKAVHKAFGTKDKDELARKLTKPSDADKSKSRTARTRTSDRLNDRTSKAARIKKGDYDNAERYGGSRLEKYPAAHSSTDKAYSGLRRLRTKRKANK